MLNKKIMVMILVVALLLSVSVFAQDERFFGHLNFALGFPQNEFKDNVDNTGFGGFGQFGYQIPTMPLQIGASIGFLVYGSDSRKESFNPNIPEVKVDVTTTNSIFMGHLLVRIQPREGVFRPYLTGLFGFNYLSTSTSVKSENNWNDDNEIASSNNFDDGTMSYGGGIGLLIRVYQASYEKIDQGNPLRGVYIDLGINSIHGGEAEYLKEGSIHQDANGKLIYDVYRSKTDLITWHIGACLSF